MVDGEGNANGVSQRPEAQEAATEAEAGPKELVTLLLMPDGKFAMKTPAKIPWVLIMRAMVDQLEEVRYQVFSGTLKAEAHAAQQQAMQELQAQQMLEQIRRGRG